MSDLTTIKARIDAGDPARVYLDFYGSHWIELTSSGIVPWKTRVRLNPHEANELRASISLRGAVVPARPSRSGASYRTYRGGYINFLLLWIGREIGAVTELPRAIPKPPLSGASAQLAARAATAKLADAARTLRAGWPA